MEGEKVGGMERLLMPGFAKKVRAMCFERAYNTKNWGWRKLSM